MADDNDTLDYLDDLSNEPRAGRDTPPGDEPENLLTMPEDKAAKTLVREWNLSWRDVRSLMAQWKVNRARSQGFTGVRLLKLQNENRAYIPAGASPNVAGMNKALRLKRRVRATLFSDPALPEATPATDSPEDRDGAEVSTRVLQEIVSEGNLSFNQKAGDAFDLASDYGSGFIFYHVDQYGGGWRPTEIEATRFAEHASAPDVPDPLQPQVPAKKFLRYVREDGTLTDDRNDPQVRKEWLKRIKDELLTGKHVRFIPSTARDLWDADGVMVGVMVPWGSLRRTFPKLGELSSERKAAILSARPQNVKDLLPADKKNDPKDREDETLVFVLTTYRVQCYDYPKGAYLIVCGDDHLLHRQEWWDEVHGEPLDIPGAQFKQLHEDDNSYGQGLMEFLGPGNEIRALMLGAMLEHLDKFNRRKIFVPMTNPIQPHQLQSPTYTVIPTLPGQQPTYEELPDFPVIVEKMYAMMNQDLDDESGLQTAGQGLRSPEVKSGLHFQAQVEQVMLGLSEVRENTERAIIRSWRIILQLVRAFYTEPQQMKWLGEDGRYKMKAWTAEDLGGTRDVRIQKGSFTQLTASAKAALAQSLAQAGVLNPHQLQNALLSNVGGMLTMQDDPHRLRVRQQVSDWQQGPPEGWTPPQAPVEPMTGQPMVDPQTGQPMPAPPDPVLGALFAPLPVDEEPQTAALRAYELGRAVAGGRFGRFPPEWQAGLVQAYEVARKAAGQMTLAEQQQAQAQQQQAGAQQQAADLQAKTAQSELKERAQTQREQIKTERELTLAQVEGETRRAAELADIVAAQT